MKTSHGFISIALLVILGILVIGGGVYLVTKNSNNTSPEEQVILDDFNLLDNSTETKTQPTSKENINTVSEINFEEALTTFIKKYSYIGLQTNDEFTPKITTQSENYRCSPSANELQTTTEKTIQETKFCVKLQTEGAAGSSYITYEYIKPLPQGTKTARFVVRFPGCRNYDEPALSKCTQEQKEFTQKIDLVIAEILQ